jgi:hypothetical protein
MSTGGGGYAEHFSWHILQSGDGMGPLPAYANRSDIHADVGLGERRRTHYND